MQMIEYKWTIPATATTEERHIVEVAQDWAMETLLDMDTTNEKLPMACTLVEVQAPSSSSLTALERQFCLDVPHTLQALVTEFMQSIQLKAPFQLLPSDKMELLETCAMVVTKEVDFISILDTLIQEDEAIIPGVRLLERLSAISLTQSPRTLMECLAFETRARLWAGDAGLWSQQLETWLVQVHEHPFLPIGDVFAWNVTSFHAREVLNRFSHLYILMIEWFVANVVEAGCLRASRTIELLSTLSNLLKTDSIDDQAFNRRRFFSSTFTRRLLVVQQNSSVYEIIGLLEQPGFVQIAMDVVLRNSEDMKQEEMCEALRFLVWMTENPRETSRPIPLQDCTLELIEALRCSNLKDGVQWLQHHRSHFAIEPLLCLRITWTWLVFCVLSVSHTEEDQHLVVEALESVEYVFRRFPPSDGGRYVKKPFRTANELIMFV